MQSLNNLKKLNKKNTLSIVPPEEIEKERLKTPTITELPSVSALQEKIDKLRKRVDDIECFMLGGTSLSSSRYFDDDDDDYDEDSYPTYNMNECSSEDEFQEKYPKRYKRID